MKIGDKVRFLSEVGGGIVTGFQGKDIALVEDADGFDIPMPVRECVVIDADDYNIKRKPVAQKDVPDAAKSKGAVQTVKKSMEEEEDERPITYRAAERPLFHKISKQFRAPVLMLILSMTVTIRFHLLIFVPKVIIGVCGVGELCSRILNSISKSLTRAF